MLNVGKGHTIAVAERGQSDFFTVFLIHGGPGNSAAQFAALPRPPGFHFILIDQRGCGNSKPLACTKNNTVADLVNDIEVVRKKLKLDKIILLGFSWGSYLALEYAKLYKANVKSMILISPWLHRERDVNAFLWESSNFFPDSHSNLRHIIKKIIKQINKKLAPSNADNTNGNPNKLIDHDNNDDTDGVDIGDDILKQEDSYAYSLDFDIPYNYSINNSRSLLDAVGFILKHGSLSARRQLAGAWTAYETKLATNVSLNPSQIEAISAEPEIMTTLIFEHYFFSTLKNSEPFSNNIDKIRDIPCHIIQGRYDFVTPPACAFELKKLLPHSVLHIVENGCHVFSDQSMLTIIDQAFKSIAEKLKN